MRMDIKVIKSECVCLPKGIGVLFDRGFIRIMLIWWNVVIRFRKEMLIVQIDDSTEVTHSGQSFSYKEFVDVSEG